MRSIMTALLLVIGLAVGAGAATPQGGTLACGDAASCAAATVAWGGRFEPTLTPGLPEQCAVAASPAPPFLCDHFVLELALPPGYWAGRPGAVEVAIRWHSESTDKDLDLFVYREGEPVGRSSGQDSSAEVAHVRSLANGTYDIYVVPVSLSEARDYEGRIEVESDAPVEPLRDLLPNMRTLPPNTVKIATAEYLVDPVHNTVVSCYPEETLDEDEDLPARCLRFDQIAANFGDGPLELRYVPDLLGNPELRQIIHRSDGTRTDRAAETMEFHPIHGHWHYKGFGLGRLYDPDGNLVAENHKKGFCLIEVDFEHWGLKGNSPRTKSYPGCQLPNDGSEVVQGIGVGWADVYNWFLADQFIDITDLPDGIYRLEVVADPDDTLLESDETDNAGSTWVCLDGMNVTKVDSSSSACP